MKAGALARAIARPKRRTVRPPRRAGTVAATGPAFAALVHKDGAGRGIGVAAENKDAGPFASLPDGAALRKKYAAYDGLAQARIARALVEPGVKAKANYTNVGTGGELHLLGRFLIAGSYVLGRNLHFQDQILRDFRANNRKFVVDVAVRQGKLFLLPVDGQYWHARTMAQQVDAVKRDHALQSLGEVIVVPDTVTYKARDLDVFLNMHGVR